VIKILISDFFQNNILNNIIMDGNLSNNLQKFINGMATTILDIEMAHDEKDNAIMGIMNYYYPDDDDNNDQKYGFTHYPGKKCKIKEDCCTDFYYCRWCHDDAENHTINRFKINRMKCMICTKEQHVSDRCINCDVQMAPYFCNICNLFATVNIDRTYHCDKCGSCRVKPSVDSKLIHCDRCANCVVEDHICIDNNFASDCPICMEYLFTSMDPCTVMKCGHAIHIACLNEMIKNNNYKCPLCMRTIINNTEINKQIDKIKQLMPMPDKYKYTKAEISCDDCQNKSIVQYHFLYNQCNDMKCESYNTYIIRTFTQQNIEDNTENL
jgi:hypothetical protein